MDENTRKIILQIRTEKNWEDAAEVTLLGQESEGTNANTRFEYNLEYALKSIDAGAYKAVSCVFPVNFAPTPCETWPSFLLDFFPQGPVLKYIVEHHKISDRPENSWKLLKIACLNPPGNVRILHPKHLEIQKTEHPGFSREEVLEKGPSFLEYMIANGAPVAGTTGAGGAAPKFLLREDLRGRFHADGVLDDAKTKECWLIKYPRKQDLRDKLVLKNESKYLEVAQKVGLKVDKLTLWERDCLFVPRFDRKIKKRIMEYYGLESFYSLVEPSDFGSRFHHETYLDAIKKFSTHPKEDALEYVFRDFLNIMMGNTDNHGRNVSMMKTKDETCLSPLYDFAPMKFDSEIIIRIIRWHLHSDFDVGGIAKTLEDKGLISNAEFTRYLKTFYSGIKPIETLLRDVGIYPTMISGTEEDRNFLLDGISKYLRS
jgi:serine/threonine-protein kinase HipA